MKAVLFPVGEKREIVDIEPAEGGWLPVLQEAVGGLIEPFDVLFGDEPLLYVNEEGLVNGMHPNRTVMADSAMEEAGMVSPIDGRTPAMRGEVYTVLFGPILAVSYGPDGEIRDMTDEEVDKVCRRVGGPFSGLQAIVEVMSGLYPRQRGLEAL